MAFSSPHRVHLVLPWPPLPSTACPYMEHEEEEEFKIKIFLWKRRRRKKISPNMYSGARDIRHSRRDRTKKKKKKKRKGPSNKAHIQTDRTSRIYLFNKMYLYKYIYSLYSLSFLGAQLGLFQLFRAHCIGCRCGDKEAGANPDLENKRTCV